MLRKLAITIGTLLGLVLLLLAGAFGLAQTRFGQDRLAVLIARQLGTPEQPADVAGLSGFLPFDMRLAQLRLRDPQGVWLEVEDARLRIRAAALLRGAVEIETVGARRVALDHLPPSPPSEEPFALPQLPRLPRSLPSVAIDRLYLDRLALGAPVLGQAAEFSVDGAGAAGPDGARLGLRVARTDQPTAKAALDAALDLASQRLRLDLQGSETGGLLASATGRPEAGDLTLTLQGDGPLADWRGRLDLDAERLAKAGLDLGLSHAAAWRLELSGALDAAPGLLPADIAGVLGSRAELALAAQETAPDQVRLEHLRLQAGALTAAGEGDFDLGVETLRATLRLAAPDLAPFSALAATPLAGRAELRLDATGAFARPDLTLDLDAGDLAAGTASLEHLTGTVGLASPTPSAQELRATAQIAGEGLRLNGRGFGDGKVELSLDGALIQGRQARLGSLALRSALAQATASGSFDLERRAGAARLDARAPDLAAAAGALAVALPVTGALGLGADITALDGLRAIDIAVTGNGTGLAGLPPGAQELVGADPTLAVEARIEPETAVTVARLELVGAGMHLEGEPRLGLPGQELGGELRLSILDLAPLRAALKQPVAGAVDLRAGLGGTVAVPEITLDGAAERVQVGAEAIDRVTVAGRLAGPLDTPSGAARLAATRQRQELTVATDYRLADGLLSLTGLTLEGPATRLAGHLDVTLAGPLARGALSGGIRDLGALQPWLGQRLSGAADLNLTLATPSNRQDATLRVAATGVGGDFGSLRRADLAASVSDLLGRGAVGADLTAQGLTTADLSLDRAKVNVGGRLAALDVTATTAGSQAGRLFDLNARAAVEPLGPRQRIQLSRLDGTLAGEALRLGAPATVTLEGRRIDLDRLDLALGPARLSGNLALGDSQVRGELALARLSLATLERFGAPALAGTGEAQLTLSGTRKAPELALTAGLAKAALAPAGPGSVDAGLRGRLADGTLQADLALTGLGAQPLTLAATLPARLSLDPPGFALADNAPLGGRLAGPVDLPTVARLAAQDGTQLSGVLMTGLDLSGTLAQPRLTGTMTLADGSVQDLRSGLRLSKVALRARADGDRLTIESLSAADPAGGTLRGQGVVRLLAGGEMAFDLTVDAAHARLLDNTLGVVVLSGTASATGSPSRILARADLTLDRGDFQIPDSVGPSVPTIEVKEVRGGAPVEQPTRGGPPLDIAFNVKLDAPARLYVRGRGLDSEWSGKIALKGDLADPLVEGQLDIRRGFLDLLDRRFEIERGVITFVGSRPPLPMIDLSATATTSNVTVTVTALGPATDPKITLSSDPQLPQDEILSHLLFGTSVARITPMQGLRLAAALDDLRGEGFVSSAFTKVRRAIGLDTLDVNSTETTDESGETTSDTTARAGKYVTDQVYLEAERSVTTGTNKARVKVDLTPNLSVGTTVDDQAQTGVGLQWRYDY